MVLQRFRLISLLLLLGGLIVMAQRPALAGTTPDWVGDFTDFHSPAWKQHWGTIGDELKCNIAVGVATCNWGYANLKGVPSAEVPGGGQALETSYPARSGPPSCNCGLGGGQFYQDLKLAGKPALVASPTIDFKYWYRFPVGFDFGGMTSGKMPGLYGGPPGCGSGMQRCGGAWSTRYMWRGGGQAAPNGEVYWYSENGASGYGEDLGTGSWRFIADGKWHSMEQLLNFTAGRMTVWHDGKQVFQTNRGFGGTPVLGIFFSTFHGGHETSWSPSKLTKAEFANFSLSTDGPQTDAPPAGMVPDAGSPPPPPPAPDAGATGTGSGGAGGESGSGGASGSGGSTPPGTVAGTGGAPAGPSLGSGGTVGGLGVTTAAAGGCRVAAGALLDQGGGAAAALMGLSAALGLLLARRRRQRSRD